MAFQKTHILVVDDDRDYALKLKNCLREIGEVNLVHSEEEFRAVFSPYKFDLILLDLRLREGKEGLDLLDYIIEEAPSSVVIVISGYGDIATAVEALQKGAKTFLEKARVTPHEIRVRAEHALKESAAERRIRQLESSLKPDEIVGDDPKIQKIRDLIKLVAQDGETTVLIRGETGTGKELVAKAIHMLGVRSKGPFVAVALTEKNPETIISELFGHEKASFTGATARHYGYFEQAHKGILFLDEIGDLPGEIQVQLLRAIDQRTFMRMGGTKNIKVDVQIVTATNRPLEEMIKENRFREDLYYRLKVFEIQLPPLRERRIDIQLLAQHFLLQLRKKGRTSAKSFSKDAIELMFVYRWPGNVRELKAVVESAALRCNIGNSAKVTKNYLESLLMDHDKPVEAKDDDVFRRLAETELKLVENALIRSGGKKGEVWKLLNYKNRFTMLRRVKRIMSAHPELAERFPALKKSYS